MTFPRVMLFIVATVVAVALALVVNTLFIDERGEMNTSSVGVPTIGGPFKLVNHKGKTVTEADYSGQYLLVFFGYTYCPDVCPTALTDMRNALDILGGAADKVAPVFITVDPERDTPEHLKEYIGYFIRAWSG